MLNLARAPEPTASAVENGPGAVEVAVVADPALIEAEWRAFEADAAGHVFQTYDFVSLWQAHVGVRRGVAPAIVVGRTVGGETLFILPFGLRRRLGARLLEWLGDEQADYHGGLYGRRFLAALSQPDDARRFVERTVALFRGEADALRFVRQPEALGGETNPFAAWRTEPHASQSHLTRLGDDFDAYYRAKRNSASRRHDRQKRERLEALGPVAAVDARSGAEAEAILAALTEQKRASLRARGARDMFAAPGVVDFYRALAALPFPAGPSHVSAVRAGDRIVAANWGLVRGGRYYYVLTSYDQAAGAFSPGSIMLHHLMRWCVERRIPELDFTVGDEAFKTQWCETRSTLYDAVLSLSPRGAPLTSALRRHAALKRYVKARPRLRSLAAALRRGLSPARRAPRA